MSAVDADEDALLLEALAFIGDLDFDVDIADEEDVLSSLLYEDGLMDFLPTGDPALTATVRNSDELTQVTVSSSFSHHTKHVESSDLLASKALISAERRPKTFDANPTPRNPSRTRQRDELVYLRELVEDLEERLTSLRPSLSEGGTDSSPEESNELVGAWAQIATRQYKQRQESETENIRLKRLLQDQIHLGRRFERLLLKKRSTLESLESTLVASKRLRRTNSRSWKSGFEFEELFTCCARQYADTTRVLTKFSGNFPVIGHRDVDLVHDPELGLTVEIKERRILPFSYEDTASEIWGFHPSDTPAHSTHDFYDIHQTDDTLQVRIRILADVNGTHGEFSVTMMTRRYVEQHRTVMVWSGIAQPSEIANVKMEGVRIRFSAWIILEPLESRNATKIAAFDVSVPEADDGMHDQSRKVGTLTDFLLNSMVIERDYRSQQWENRLFRRALSSSQ